MPAVFQVSAIDSRLLYTGLVALIASLRLAELGVSRRNTRRLLAAGAREAGAGHYPAMVLLHTAFLAACPLEVWLLDRPLVPPLAAAMLLTLAAGFALRYWAIRTLAGRWTTRVLALPAAPPVTTGPYRYLRHPNYLAVILEVAALPLVHTAWLTALLFSPANALLLRLRVREEEAALEGAGGYSAHFAGRRRFLPGGGGS